MSAKKTILAAAQTLADAAVPHGAGWVWVQQALVRQAANLGSSRRGLRMPWPLPPGAVVPDEAAAAPAQLLLDLDADLTDMAVIGALYEALLEHDLTGGRVTKSKDPSRKASGAWYTPPEIAAAMCALALGQGLRQSDGLNPGSGPDAVLAVKAVDPACGAGVFLVAAARWLEAAYVRRGGDPGCALVLAVEHCVRGTDIDPIAVDLAVTLLWWELGGRVSLGWLMERVRVGDTLAGPDAAPGLCEGQVAA